jgi:RNA polymerase sigma-70 factor (ECF subfamily)
MALGSQKDVFLDHLDPTLRRAYAGVADLEGRLERALAEARAAWPDLPDAEESFLMYLAEHAPLGVDADNALDHLHAADLYLAFGCARGERSALDGFDRTFRVDIDAIVRRFEGSGLAGDDLRQALHEKLFVGKSGAHPKIADYSGQGFLQNWIRVTTVRAFTDLARVSVRPSAQSPEEELLALADSDDLELSFLKKHYRAGFKRAFEEAVRELDPRERNLLRQSVVHGLGIDQVAAVYGIHRATAARRIEKARDALLTATRKSLMTTLAIDKTEFESVMALIRSRLDVSIHRVLGSKSEG